MEEFIHALADTLSLLIEGFAIAFIAIGLALAGALAMIELLRQRARDRAYEKLRKRVGRILILGLEFLIAGEILRSISVGETAESVLALGVVVVIRTLLSVTIEMEINGHWPWQSHRPPADIQADLQAEIQAQGGSNDQDGL